MADFAHRLGDGTEEYGPSAEIDAGTEPLRQVWCVVYDSPNPSMDGQPHPIRMADQDYEIAFRNYEFMQRQQRVAPKRNLRIETRWVSGYTRVFPPGVGDSDG